MEWSLEKPHLHPSTPLQYNTQRSLGSGVSPSGLRTQDSEIPNLASLLTISSPNSSGSDPNCLFSSDFLIFFMRSVSHCFKYSTCPTVVLTHSLHTSSPALIYNWLSSMTTTLPLIPLVFAVVRSNLSTTHWNWPLVSHLEVITSLFWLILNLCCMALSNL